jgi:hypothetical protein
MTRRIRKPKCKHCTEFFPPDYRNAKRQKFCSKPGCRKASKADSQRRWLQKPENQNYFRGSHNVNRVRQWRKDHPRYWQRKVPAESDALQDPLHENIMEKQTVEGLLPKHALQDLLALQHPVFIGLIAQLTGSTLQDDIANTLHRMQRLGNDVLRQPIKHKGGSYDQKVPPMSPAGPKGPRAVQLGRPPTGS